MQQNVDYHDIMKIRAVTQATNRDIRDQEWIEFFVLTWANDILAY